jgi:hypothetical protein
MELTGTKKASRVENPLNFGSECVFLRRADKGAVAAAFLLCVRRVQRVHTLITRHHRGAIDAFRSKKISALFAQIFMPLYSTARNPLTDDLIAVADARPSSRRRPSFTSSSFG